MIPEKWHEIKDQINENFEVLNSGEESIENIPNSKLEFIEFNGPLGQMRLEFITKPRVLDKKTIYSNRIGSSVKEEYIYSEDEVVHQFKALKWNEMSDDWREVEFDL